MLQAIGVEGAPGRFAVAAGGAALILDLECQPATLANVIGALSLPSRPQHVQHVAGPAALAASVALDEEELRRLVGPRGAIAGALQYSIGDIDRESARDALLVEAPVVWALPGSKELRAAEEVAWGQLVDAGSRKKGLTEETFSSICTPLLDKAKALRASISYDLLCKLLLAAVGE